MNLPDLNRRLKEVIDYETKGNITAFARMIDVLQQKLDRLFKIDPRTNKYPSVPSEILVNITEFCVHVNIEWLLSGNGEMIKTKSIENFLNENSEEKTKSIENFLIRNEEKNDEYSTENEKYKKSPLLTTENGGEISDTEVKTFRLKTDKDQDIQRVPLYDMEAVAGLVPLFSDTIKQRPIDFIQIPNLPKCDGAVYITGDSMYPLLKSGDIVLYKRVNDIENSIFWGEMYLISVDFDGEEYVTVKYIQKSTRPEFVRLVSYNQHHDEKEVPISKIRALAFIKASIRINSMK